MGLKPMRILSLCGSSLHLVSPGFRIFVAKLLFRALEQVLASDRGTRLGAFRPLEFACKKTAGISSLELDSSQRIGENPVTSGCRWETSLRRNEFGKELLPKDRVAPIGGADKK